MGQARCLGKLVPVLGDHGMQKLDTVLPLRRNYWSQLLDGLGMLPGLSSG